MRLPEGGAPSKVVVNQCVFQQVVTHVESVGYGRRMRVAAGRLTLGIARARAPESPVEPNDVGGQAVVAGWQRPYAGRLKRVA
jgi:hypothetical protein